MHADITHLRWHALNDAEIVIARGLDTLFDTARKDDPESLTVLRAAQHDIRLRGATCLLCERTVRFDPKVVAIVAMPLDAELVHCATAYFVCDCCSWWMSDGDILSVVLGDAYALGDAT